MLRRVRLLPFLPLALLVVLAVRALRPLVKIRFGQFPTTLIGNLTRSMEIHHCELDAGLHGPRTIDIWYRQGSVSNHQLLKMWSRNLHVSQLVSIPDRLNQWLPGGESHVIPWYDNGTRDPDALLAKSKPHLQFTKEEEELGAAFLRQSGVPEGGNFICFHTRDPAYRRVNFPGRDDHHNSYRNANILNYLPAVEELTRRGYYAFRMGAEVAEPLPPMNSNIIDYATNDRTDFLDIYLPAKCRFFLGNGSGIDSVSMIFRKPVIHASYASLNYAGNHWPEDLTVPKKLWLRDEQRFLTFREILDSGIGKFLTTHRYEQAGIELIESTPEEITAVAVEMDERLNGTWQTAEEDEELQRRFWSLFEPSKLSRVFLSRIGAEYLRQNRDLLDET